MIEKEVRGFLNKDDFDSKLGAFEQKFGVPKKSRRLSITFADYDNLTLETKIRITNGVCEVVQKVGEFTALEREEITVSLVNANEDVVFGLYKTYRNFLKDVKNPMLTLIQHQNFVFLTDMFEIKLYRQFGNSEFYAFEVESLVDMDNIELDNFCNKNDLLIDENYNNKDLIKIRNTKVNMDMKNISDTDIRAIIRSYLV